jgi:prevent-host-death family protein
MSRIVNVHEAKTHLSRLLEVVVAGEEIIIAKNGIPYAKLVPIEAPGSRPLGFVKGRVSERFFEPLPDDELDMWEGTSGGK